MCNEENETKKLFLRQYQASRRREKEIAEELVALEAAYLPKSPNIDGMPHGEAEQTLQHSRRDMMTYTRSLKSNRNTA